MEEIIRDIIARICLQKSTQKQPLDGLEVEAIVRAHNKGRMPKDGQYAKKHIFPFFMQQKQAQSNFYKSLNLDEETESVLVRSIQMKPRRTTSGVATITVITQPYPCANNCAYCPNDIRMPKSYLHKEPACQRAEKNNFDPLLQVASRLHALIDMGHPTDKIELIVSGGSFLSYPEAYRKWFITELFRALNFKDTASLEKEIEKRRTFYKSLHLSNDADTIKKEAEAIQAQIDEGKLTYNEAYLAFYGAQTKWQTLAEHQTATEEDLTRQHTQNENSKHRVVGLVIETNPESITAENLMHIRSLGVTKIQMGIQSLREDVLAKNNRALTRVQIQNAMELMRLFGFKLHVHMMCNLYGSTQNADIQDYLELVNNDAFKPDEVKLYPTTLTQGTHLETLYNEGKWQPYMQEELIHILLENLKATPPYVRISRVIRDFSAEDVLAGNKTSNLRQLVEARAKNGNANIQEIRYREIDSLHIDPSALSMKEYVYSTEVSTEYFLQWVNSENKIAGFLRLSLPKEKAFLRYKNLPTLPTDAMIREVHVYGRTARIHKDSAGAQHLGLGKKLIARAEEIARECGYANIKVISAIGTRTYYKNLGFDLRGLYQEKTLFTE